MKRNLLLLAVIGTVLAFTGQASAQDLGVPDTLYVETFDCTHEYNGHTGAGYDSVVLGIYVTHDSNTFYWDPPGKFVQDSISGFVVPLAWWTVLQGGCTPDSVIIPFGGAEQWNNDVTTMFDPRFKRSLFRHLKDEHSGDTTYNRFAQMVNDMFLPPWTLTLTIDPGPDDGYFFMSLLPASASNRRWWEGSKVLMASITFLVYGMTPPNCIDPGGVDICVRDTLWGTTGLLAYTRYDAVNYVPQHFLPACDHIYIIPNEPPDITCNGDYTTHKADVVVDFNVTDAENDPCNVSYTMTPAGGGTAVLVPTSGTPPFGGTFTYTPNCITDPALGPFTVCLFANDGNAYDSCCFTITVTNDPPTVTCPPSETIHANSFTYVGNFTYSDPEGDHVTMTLGDPQGTGAVMVDNGDGTGTVTWTPPCQAIGNQYLFSLTATDQCGDEDFCEWTLTVTNNPPSCVLTCPDSAFQGIAIPGSFTADDPDGDLIASISAVATDGFVSGLTPTSGHPVVNGTFLYNPPPAPFLGPVTITMTVVDTCGATSQCDCTFDVVEAPAFPNQVIIPNMVYERFGFGHWDYFPWDYNGQNNKIVLDDKCPPYLGVSPGDFVSIPIVLNNFNQPPDFVKVGGFELEVEFDYIDLTFYGAERGGLLSARYMGENPQPGADSIFWSWEYFSYRVLPCPLCACCKYKILIYGQAEMPDGLLRRGYCLATAPTFPEEFWYEDVVTEYQDGTPVDPPISFASLVWLNFQVANSELLRDLKLPVIFEWEHKLGGVFPDYYIIQDWDCAENTMSNCTGEILYVSKDMMQYDTTICGMSQPGGGEILPILDFVDGGVHVCSPCTAFKCVRGDINLNHIAYETADAVLFARALIFGATAVFWSLDEQLCATDVNADGRTMMLSDLIYLIRVIQRDAIPYPKLGPSSDIAHVVVSAGRITVECASTIGGLMLEFDGAVTPTLLTPDMELIANDSKILVWSSEGNSINAGASEILTVAGAELVSVTAVDREGRELTTTITHKVAPSAFALHPAYPNPFNPCTNLSFTLPNAVPYSLKIYNVAGQLVKSYEGMGVAGLNMITWDANDGSSGVYFLKLSAGPYNATSKMVLMK